MYYLVLLVFELYKTSVTLCLVLLALHHVSKFPAYYCKYV